MTGYILLPTGCRMRSEDGALPAGQAKDEQAAGTTAGIYSEAESPKIL